jgi:hypothetical protein
MSEHSEDFVFRVGAINGVVCAFMFLWVSGELVFSETWPSLVFLGMGLATAWIAWDFWRGGGWFAA